MGENMLVGEIEFVELEHLKGGIRGLTSRGCASRTRFLYLHRH